MKVKNRVAQLITYLFSHLLGMVGLRGLIAGPCLGAVFLEFDGNASLLIPSSASPNYLNQLRVLGLFTFLLDPRGNQVFEEAYAAYEALDGQTLEAAGKVAIEKVSQK